MERKEKRRHNKKILPLAGLLFDTLENVFAKFSCLGLPFPPTVALRTCAVALSLSSFYYQPYKSNMCAFVSSRSPLFGLENCTTIKENGCEAAPAFLKRV